MSVLLLTLPLLWAQVNPAPTGPAARPPEAAQAQAAGATAKAPGPPGAPGAATPAAAANPAPAMPVPPPISQGLMTALAWTYIAGDPGFTVEGLLGGFLTWLKAVSLLCLVAWVLSWLVIGVKERVIGRGGWIDYVFLAALILTPLTVMLRVLETVEKLPVYKVGPIGLTALAVLVCTLLYVIWVEVAIWRTIRRLGRGVDLGVLVGVHLAMALGLAGGVSLQQLKFLDFLFMRPPGTFTWIDGLIYGLRISVTYMGYIVGLRILGLFLYELVAVRGRRLFSIALLSIHEANRRMWAPWVVITVFLLVLAFTHWFLQPPRAAEMGRLYVGTLTLLCSVLLTVMVTILTPLSLPTDIQQQTIYTVVSKPVRRLEMIWGRMIGYMVLVTVLIVLFGGVSLLYLRRTVGDHDRPDRGGGDQGEARGPSIGFQAADGAGRPASHADPGPGAGQGLAVVPRLARDTARHGDRRGVGPERCGSRGATSRAQRRRRPSGASGWCPTRSPRPAGSPGRSNRRIPVDDFLRASTIEWDLDRIYQLQEQIQAAQVSKSKPDVSASVASRLDATIARNQAELDRIQSDYEAKKRQSDELDGRATEAETAEQE